MPAWNGWYHVNGNTYGTWLRGDPRGWRARHHREHVDGDYKNPPPPGMYDTIERYSRQLMPHDAVRLSSNQREIACREMVASLLRHGVELLALALDDHHFHLLARFPAPAPTDSDPWALRIPRRKDGKAQIAIARHFVGIAKKDSARALSDAGLAPQGGIWGKRSRIQPIRDRSHQLNVFNYIAKHASRGAVVWTFRHDRKVAEQFRSC